MNCCETTGMIHSTSVRSEPCKRIQRDAIDHAQITAGPALFRKREMIPRVLLALALVSCVWGCERGADVKESEVSVVRDDARQLAGAETELSPTAERQVIRVGGDSAVQVKRSAEGYRAGASAITTPLPEGYPIPTPPGAIELKWYPPVRRAEIAGRPGQGPEEGRNRAFWPLFKHIDSRNIAMTSPVEMDYRAGSFDQPMTDGKNIENGWPDKDSKGELGEESGWSMSFLYRSADNGPTCQDGEIRVYDAPAVTMLSIGQRGAYSASLRREGVRRLHEWLEKHPEWCVAGSPRALYYNDPMVLPWNKWSETQLPVIRVRP